MVFHWTPDIMDRMDLAELMMWREKARARFEAQHGSPEPQG